MKHVICLASMKVSNYVHVVLITVKRDNVY